MIRKTGDLEEGKQVYARARAIAGADEQYLAPDWLARPDVYCVAQENERHGLHIERESLTGALGLFPRTRWFLASLRPGAVREIVELSDPILYLFDNDVNHLCLPTDWTVANMMLFSMDHDAVILYSHTYEFKLIAGSAAFVRAYIDGARGQL